MQLDPTPIAAAPIPACRDRSRNPAAKLATLNRRKARALKSAALFLAFAFPANMGEAV